mmetsp:Transcript_519/g.1347  ORF Transcript_519/g.1347 Transcript_519/m.1347 type:complete len:218 (+) Transcript_519:530-1183(+)
MLRYCSTNPAYASSLSSKASSSSTPAAMISSPSISSSCLISSSSSTSRSSSSRIASTSAAFSFASSISCTRSTSWAITCSDAVSVRTSRPPACLPLGVLGVGVPAGSDVPADAASLLPSASACDSSRRSSRVGKSRSVIECSEPDICKPADGSYSNALWKLELDSSRSSDGRCCSSSAMLLVAVSLLVRTVGAAAEAQRRSSTRATDGLLSTTKQAS